MSQSKKRDYRLHSSLTRGLSESKKEIVEDGFKSSRSFLDVIVDRLEKTLEQKIKEGEDRFSYKDNNWELHQAHDYGYRTALRDFIGYFVDNKSKDI